MKYVITWVIVMSVLGIEKSSFREFSSLKAAQDFYVIKAAERDSCLNKNCSKYITEIKIDSIKVK